MLLGPHLPNHTKDFESPALELRARVVSSCCWYDEQCPSWPTEHPLCLCIPLLHTHSASLYSVMTHFVVNWLVCLVIHYSTWPIWWLTSICKGKDKIVLALDLILHNKDIRDSRETATCAVIHASKGRQVVSFRAQTLFPCKTRNEGWIDPSLDALGKRNIYCLWQTLRHTWIFSCPDTRLVTTLTQLLLDLS